MQCERGKRCTDIPLGAKASRRLRKKGVNSSTCSITWLETAISNHPGGTPTGIPRDDANARLPIDTGMARGQQINGCGHLAIILEPMLSDVEAMHLNRSP